MCGICGIVEWQSEKALDLPELKRMVWMIRHRGPDEFALYLDPPSPGPRAGLGHTRLSIIDLSGGGQPMTNEDGTLWITFNGEIYNYKELTPELERRGHRFATKCDTEVILHLYEEYGPRCVDHMNGQFAFAIWDRNKRRVFMARDRMGVRPLFYAQLGSRLLFASEVKSLIAAGVPARLDPIGVDQVFTFWSCQAPRTIFEGVQQLPAAHHLTADANGLHIERYWNLDFPAAGETGDPRSAAEYAEGLREELIRATRLRMRADVPVGAYLSGGLDSTLTSAIVRRYTDANLNTFSVRFKDERFDEGAYQDAAVARLETLHRSVTVSRGDIAQQFGDVMWHTETPILRTAPAPLHILSGLVRANNVKVVVTGEGADEVLAGYNIYKEAKIRRFWARHPESKLRPLLLSKIYPYVQSAASGGSAGAAYWRQFFGKHLTEVDHPCYSHLVRWTNTATTKRFFTAALRERIGAYDGVGEVTAALPEAFAGWDPLAQAQYIEIATFMTPYLLSSQGDRVGMSHAIENRFPFLDHNLIAFASRIPARLKLRLLEEKYILREAARGLLPDLVIDRPKQPYRAPDSASFFEGAGQEAKGEGQEAFRARLSTEAIEAAGCFDPRMVARLVEKCYTMRDAAASAREDMALVGILSTQWVHHHFVEAFPNPEPPEGTSFQVREA